MCRQFEYLQAKAKRCRDLAEKASDKNAATALRQCAADIEMTMVVLKNDEPAQPAEV
jgi:hypothetical protein